MDYTKIAMTAVEELGLKVASLKVVFSARFKRYGASIIRKGKNVEIRLSKEWEGVSEDIIAGVIQELVVRVFKLKKNTDKMDLYNSFIKNLNKVMSLAEEKKQDEELSRIFDKVNRNYFYGLVDKPNLRWVKATPTKFGSYNFSTDTIEINEVLRGQRELIEYVMYHEILHKKYAFKSKNGRTVYHSKEFREKEKEFVNSKECERRLKEIASLSKLKRATKQRIPFWKRIGIRWE